jgi:hypothetical protein
VKNVPERKNHAVWGAAFGRGVHHWRFPVLNQKANLNSLALAVDLRYEGHPWGCFLAPVAVLDLSGNGWRMVECEGRWLRLSLPYTTLLGII